MKTCSFLRKTRDWRSGKRCVCVFLRAGGGGRGGGEELGGGRVRRDRGGGEGRERHFSVATSALSSESSSFSWDKWGGKMSCCWYSGT